MNPSRKVRIILTIPLVATGLLTLYYLSTALQTINDLSSLLFALGGTVWLVFVSITINDLLKNKIIARGNFIVSIIFSSITLITLALFSYGLIQDWAGVHCVGFFGAQSSCTLGPLLIVFFFLLHPLSLSLMGLLAVYGIYTQILIRKKAKSQKQ